jgi:hypothetical protein
LVETEEPRSRIAADYGISEMTIYRLCEKNQWRRERALIDVPAARKSVVAAEAAPPVDMAAIQSRTDELAQLPLVDRLQRAIETELSALERYQLTPRAYPLTPAEAERISRTLERLIATLSKVDHLRASAAPTNPAYPYDMPEDIDEFRNELARRINAFVDSRTGENADQAEPDKSNALDGNTRDEDRGRPT